MTRGRGILLVIVVSLAFSVSSPLARLARPTEPLMIALLRVTIASVLLAAIDLPGLWRRLKALTSTQRRGVIASGVLLGAHFALFQWGLELTSLAAAVSLVSLEPLAVVLTAWIAFGIRPKLGEKVGVLLATIGAFVVGQGAGHGEHKLLGDLLVLGAVVLFGLYVAFARGLKEALPPREYAASVYACAALFLAPVSLAVASLSSTEGDWLPSGFALGMIALIALIPTTLGHTLVQLGARTLSPSLIALASPGETIGSLLLGALLLGTSPTMLEGVGALVILGGSVVAILAQRAAEGAEGVPA